MTLVKCDFDIGTAQIARPHVGDNGHFSAIVCRLSARAWLETPLDADRGR